MCEKENLRSPSLEVGSTFIPLSCPSSLESSDLFTQGGGWNLGRHAFCGTAFGKLGLLYEGTLLVPSISEEVCVKECWAFWYRIYHEKLCCITIPFDMKLSNLPCWEYFDWFWGTVDPVGESFLLDHFPGKWNGYNKFYTIIRALSSQNCTGDFTFPRYTSTWWWHTLVHKLFLSLWLWIWFPHDFAEVAIGAVWAGGAGSVVAPLFLHNYIYHRVTLIYFTSPMDSSAWGLYSLLQLNWLDFYLLLWYYPLSKCTNFTHCYLLK